MNNAEGRPSTEELTGMTANERFFALGRLEEFFDAARKRDRDKMIQIYRDAEIAEAEKAVDVVLADPARYGF